MRMSRGRRSASPSASKAVTAALAAVLVALLAVACAGTGVKGASSGPVVSDAWIRPPMGAGAPAAGYLTLTGGTAHDALLSATSPAATSVEVHETTPGMSGMMAMHPVDRVDVPAGSTVRFEPGGYHLMLFGVDPALAPGTTVEITLLLETSPDIIVQAEVRAN